MGFFGLGFVAFVILVALVVAPMTLGSQVVALGASRRDLQWWYGAQVILFAAILILGAIALLLR